MRVPIRMNKAVPSSRPTRIIHRAKMPRGESASGAPNMMMLSRMISSETGTMMKLASRLAARVDVVWLEITTAPVTISRA